MNGTFIKRYLAVLKQKKITGNICFSEQIFYRKQSLGAAEKSQKQWLEFDASKKTITDLLNFFLLCMYGCLRFPTVFTTLTYSYIVCT